MGILRLFLAALVVLTHFNHNLFGVKLMPGNICVEMFFVISGYYMALILSEKKYTNALNFYASRFLRLYPLFIFIALLIILKTFLYEQITGKLAMTGMTFLNSPNWLKNLANISNVTMFGQDIFSLFHMNSAQKISMFYGNYSTGTDKYGFSWGGELRWNGPAWSIGLEIWFYFLIPWLNKLKELWLYILLFFSIAIKLYIEIAFNYDTYFLFPCQLYLFILGMIAYRNKTIHFYISKKSSIFMLVILIGLILSYNYLPYKSAIRYLIPIILFLNINFIFNLTRKHKWDQKIGEYSYPIYISHMLFINTFIQVIEKLGAKISPIAEIITISIAIMLFSYFWIRFIEPFINKQRYKFVAG